MIDFGGTHSDQLENFLFPYFKVLFLDQKLYYRKYEIVFVQDRDADYAFKIFKHLTSYDNKYGSRSIDTERAKRLSWFPAIVSHPDDPNILCFDYCEAKGTIRTYLFLLPYDYLIILQKDEININARIISAYYVDQKWSKKSYIDKYNKRIK